MTDSTDTVRTIRYLNSELKPIDERMAELEIKRFADYVNCLIEHDLFYRDFKKRNEIHSAIDDIIRGAKALGVDPGTAVETIARTSPEHIRRLFLKKLELMKAGDSIDSSVESGHTERSDAC